MRSDSALRKPGLQEWIEEPRNQLNHFFSGSLISHTLQAAERVFPWPEVDIIKIWTGIIEATPELSGLKPEIAAAAYESIANPVAPMPGAPEILDSLRKRGLKLGIISKCSVLHPAYS